MNYIEIRVKKLLEQVLKGEKRWKKKYGKIYREE